MVQCVGSESLPYDRSESMGGAWFWAPERGSRAGYTEQKENRPCFSHFLLLFFVSPGFLGLPAARQAAEPEESSRLEASLETSRSG